MAVSVSQLLVVLIDNPTQGILDRLEHVIYIEWCSIVIVGHVDLHLVVERRTVGRPGRERGGLYLRLPPSDAGRPRLDGLRDAQHHAVPRQIGHGRTIAPSKRQLVALRHVPGQLLACGASHDRNLPTVSTW